MERMLEALDEFKGPPRTAPSTSLARKTYHQRLKTRASGSAHRKATTTMSQWVGPKDKKRTTKPTVRRKRGYAGPSAFYKNLRLSPAKAMAQRE